MDGMSFNNSMEDSLGSPSAGHASSSTTGSSREKTKRTKVKSNQQVHMYVHVHTHMYMYEFHQLQWWVCLAYHFWLNFQ